MNVLAKDVDLLGSLGIRKADCGNLQGVFGCFPFWGCPCGFLGVLVVLVGHRMLRCGHLTLLTCVSVASAHIEAPTTPPCLYAALLFGTTGNFLEIGADTATIAVDVTKATPKHERTTTPNLVDHTHTVWSNPSQVTSQSPQSCSRWSTLPRSWAKPLVQHLSSRPRVWSKQPHRSRRESGRNSPKLGRSGFLAASSEEPGSLAGIAMSWSWRSLGHRKDSKVPETSRNMPRLGRTSERSIRNSGPGRRLPAAACAETGKQWVNHRFC